MSCKICLRVVLTIVFFLTTRLSLLGVVSANTTDGFYIYDSNGIADIKGVSEDLLANTSLVIPSSVTYCLNQYDVDHYGSEPIYKTAIVKIISYLGKSETIQSVTLPSSVEEISGFSKLSNLQTVSGGTFVKTIGYKCFDGCSELKSVSISNAEEIGNFAFYGCTSLTHLSFNSAETIGSGAFSGCTNLKSIKLLAAKYIGSSAFSQCSNLESLDLPSADTIEYQAFSRCTNLRSLNLPSAKVITSDVFNKCESLTELDLPSVTEINVEGNFSYFKRVSMPQLKKLVRLEGSYKPSLLNAVEGVIELGALVPPAVDEGIGINYTLNPKLSVPESVRQSYASDPFWGQLLFGENPLVTINKSASYGYGELDNPAPIKGITGDWTAQLAFVFDGIPGDRKISVSIKANDLKSYQVNAWSYIGELSSIQEFEPGRWGFVYTAPNIYPNYVEDSFYTVTFTMTMAGKETYEFPIEVYRPGIMLLHGLNSSRACWNSTERYLVNSDKYINAQILNVDYKSTNKASFDDNTHKYKVIEKNIPILEQRLLANGIVSAKYDMIGHSMGGILIRKYAQEVEQEHINRIVTVNTPHYGSRGANVLMRGILFLSTYNPGMLLNIYNAPAIRDLRPDSKAMKKLSEGASKGVGIPVHAVCSYMTSSGIIENSHLCHPTDMGLYLIGTIVSDPLLIPSAINLTSKDFVDEIVGSSYNDGVVSEYSQKGGLSNSKTTSFSDKFSGVLGLSSSAHHTNICHWSKFQSSLIDLLNPLTGYSQFTSGYFDPQETSSRAFALDDATAEGDDDESDEDDSEIKIAEIGKNFIDGSIRLSCELKRDTVDYVAVNLEMSDNIVANCAFTFLDSDNSIVGTNLSSYDFMIPADLKGKQKIYAIGRTADGKIVTDSCELYIDRDVEVVSIQFADRSDLLLKEGQKIIPATIGIWSDGSETDLPVDLYASDEQILSIDENNVVEAVAPGECLLEAYYGDLYDSLNVKVLPFNTADLPFVEVPIDITIDILGDNVIVKIGKDMAEGLRLMLYDMNGMVLVNENIDRPLNANETLSIPLPHASHKIYFLRAVAETGSISFKVIH